MSIFSIKSFALVLISFLLFSFTTSPDKTSPSKSVYDIQISTLMGDEFDMNSLKGKKILFVNVASKCGFTPQYEELQKLHETHGDKLTIIGVPCNQFGSQEPGSAQEIQSFCTENYGVTFMITEKVDVKGDNQSNLYAWLTQEKLNGVKDSKVKWNFQKYLLSENGELLHVFGSSTKPMSKELIDLL
jgi:glutathione peroxidase